MRQIDRAEMREALSAVVVMESKVVLRAVKAEPRTTGGVDEFAGVFQELAADVVAGVGAGDDESPDIAGVVRRIAQSSGSGAYVSVKVAIGLSSWVAT